MDHQIEPAAGGRHGAAGLHLPGERERHLAFRGEVGAGKKMNATAIAVCVLAVAAPLAAQWPSEIKPEIPRLPDGKPNLAAPPPKTADGKPDLSGVWETSPGYTGNIAKDLKPGEVAFQPWAEALYKHRVETQSKDDPQARCVLSGVPREDVVPYPFKILNTKGMIVILY